MIQRKEGAKRGTSRMPLVIASLGRCCSSTAGFADARHKTHSAATAAVKGNSAMEALGALPAWCGPKGLVVQIADPHSIAQCSPLMSFLTYRPYWVVEFGAGCGHNAIWPLLTLTTRGLK